MIYLNLLIIILIIIFIHEFGHYSLARYFKINVTDFSIGFGKSIYNFIDKNNTNWKISMIPLGGYVKCFFVSLRCCPISKTTTL